MTNYADYIIKQLEQIGQPAVSKSTSTTTMENMGQGLDFGTLAMLLYFMLSGQGGLTSKSLGTTAVPASRNFGNLPFSDVATNIFG